MTFVMTIYVSDLDSDPIETIAREMEHWHEFLAHGDLPLTGYGVTHSSGEKEVSTFERKK